MINRPDFIKNLNEVPEESHYLDKPAGNYRSRQRLGKATGANRIGVNYCLLRPGQVSSKFHYHTHEEEFFYIISGAATLRYGKEEFPLQKGDATSMKPGGPAHQIRNDSNEVCIYFAIGTREPEDSIAYPDDHVVREGSVI